MSGSGEKLIITNNAKKKTSNKKKMIDERYKNTICNRHQIQ